MSRAGLPAGRYPVPSYLPPEGHAVVPWARRQVGLLARRNRVDPGDAWDEAMTALLRACVYFKPGAGTFTAYAKVAITRGLWRYALPDRERHNHKPRQNVSLNRYMERHPDPLKGGAGSHTDYRVDVPRELQVPSCEDEVLAKEAILIRVRGNSPSYASARADRA